MENGGTVPGEFAATLSGLEKIGVPIGASNVRVYASIILESKIIKNDRHRLRFPDMFAA